MNSETWATRPSRAERSRGLELRWPAATADFVEDALEGNGFCIDIVNTGVTGWRPQADPFVVIGMLAPAGQTDFAFGWTTGGGQNRAVPLGPGEYARVPVVIGAEQWRPLQPGQYELHASNRQPRRR